MKQGANDVRLYLGNNAVDKAYLGTTQVYGGSTPWYITDGLVFHLDGINKGNDISAWTDLKGGIAFSLNEHASLETDAVVMDGVGCICPPININVPCLFAHSTIEACVERLANESYGCVFYNRPAQASSFIFSGSTKVVTSTAIATSMFTLDTNSGKNTYSCIPTKVVKNGTSYTSVSSESWASQPYISIGGRTQNGSTYSYCCKCRIHSIRIYNRILTDEEIANNQAIDNERFNLGLQL